MNARRSWPRAGIVLIVALVVALARSADANPRLGTERRIADVMIDTVGTHLRADIDPAPDIAGVRLDEASEAEPPARFAILPQVGFSPEKGTNAGLKLAHRDLGPLGLVVDLGGTYAVQGQQSYGFSVVAPRFGIEGLLAVVEGSFDEDPAKEFFGLGNNDAGPDALSSHELRRAGGRLTLGVRITPRLTIAVSGGALRVRLGRGELDEGDRSTLEAFPDLTGIEGGDVRTLAVSLVYNNREDVTRPTRGWNFTARAERSLAELGGDFEFTRYVLDASYLRPLFSRRHVIGLRVGGEFVDGPDGAVPFWQLASLGGSDDLRGFFADRFLGRSRVTINGEYRLKVLDFDFYDLWRVRIDGVGFGDLGRVFLGSDDFFDELGEDTEDLPAVLERFQLSWGGGVRVALGSALLARIDVGFSDEEDALVYLTFGHLF